MLMTVNNDPSRKLSSEDCRLLKESCDDVRTYREAGWFCVLGYKGDKRLVHAHCNSEKDYETMMGIGIPDDHYAASYPGSR